MTLSPPFDSSAYLEGLASADLASLPILDIAARMWEPDRYEAFRACYRSMRIIDDLVDHRKANGIPISAAESRQLGRMLDDLVHGLSDQNSGDTRLQSLQNTMTLFRIPRWPWERLVKAMNYDLLHDGYATFRTFRKYCEGAAIAPASVFMHLIGVKQDATGYRLPPYDIRTGARDLAIFSYLVHILRDFEKDQREGLRYFSDDLLATCQVNHNDLRNAAMNRVYDKNIRSLVYGYLRIARYYRSRAVAMVERISAELEPRYRLSLRIVLELYTQIFESLERADGEISTDRLRLESGSILARILPLLPATHGTATHVG